MNAAGDVQDEVREVDRVLADFVALVAAQLQAGQTPELEVWARDHPELANRLRGLVPTIRALTSLGQCAARGRQPGAITR